MFELIVTSFIAALVGSPHCIGMCGGFASACARTTRESVAWHAGRMSTYAALGAIAGTAGHLIPGPSWMPLAISAVLLIWFAGVLAGVLPQLGVVVPGTARVGRRLLARSDVPSRYAFGLLTALLPCGFLYFGIGFAVATASAFGGALVMIAFGIGTVPALAFLSGVVHKLATRGIWPRRILAALILAAGLWSLGMRAVRLSGGQHDMHSRMVVSMRSG